MKFRNTLILLLAMLATEGNRLQAEEAVLRFHGQLTQPQKSGQQFILREFDCVLIDGSSGSFFFVLDDPEGCPWPDTFGSSTNSAGGGVRPHLLYRFDGSPYTILLPDLKISLPDDLNKASAWSVGDWTWTVTSLPENQSGEVNLNASERRGRRQNAMFDSNTGWLTKATLDVFMGRGEQFQLELRRASVDRLSAELLVQERKAEQTLLKLQSALNRRSDSQRSDLTARQLQLAESTLNQLDDLPEDLPLQPLLRRMSQQLAGQMKSLEAADSARASLVGRNLGPLLLKQLNGQPLSADDLSGKPLVLHFWSYSQNAMEEPYGQVAYLEFLKTRLGKLDVNIIGVVTNPLLQSPDRQSAELRSARKVVEFMNLSYPVTYDDGTLQKQCDPSSTVKDDLPLWIVLDSASRVVHYHQGFYEVDRRDGLKELSDEIQAVLAKTESN